MPVLHRRNFLCAAALLSIGLGAMANLGFSQESPAPIRLTGAVNLAGEAYSSQGIDERRPHDTFRAMFAPTLIIYDQIRLPFEFYITSEDRGVRQPFNQFGVNPQFWGWLTLHAGYFSARISDLTFGDARMLGGGVEAQPGNFRFSFLYGKIQQAVEEDTLNGFRGVYDRWVWAAKVGYGAESSFHIHLNVMRAFDDSTSLSHPLPDITPQENFAVSVQYGVPILGHALTLSGEVAAAAASSDTHLAETGNLPSALKNFFTPRQSSQVDGATWMTLAIVPAPTWSLNLTGRWVGPGYVTLGYPQLPNDVVEGTVAPTVRLMNNTITLRGSLGLRYNNLRNNHFSTTKRTIGNLGVSLQPAPEWGLDVQYSNYGMQSGTRNDTLRVDNVSQSLMISPRYTFNAFGAVSTALITYSLQAYTDFNTVTGSLSDNKTNAGIGSWLLVWPSTLTLTTTLLYTASSTQMIETVIKGVTETVGHSFLDRKLTANLMLGYTRVQANGDNGQTIGRISLSYTPSTWGTFTMALSSSQFIYDPVFSSPSYREHTGSLTYSYAF